MNQNKLAEKALELRQETFNAFVEHGEAHLGGSFSIIEMLIVLYEIILEEEDKFILSKSHASFPLCLLLRKKGYQPELTTHLELDSKNGIHCTTGSLGHGLPIGAGMALAKKFKGESGRMFVMLGDGECQEGTTWETFLIADRHKLHNLIVLVDYNKIQALDRLEDALPLDDLAAKFKAFNWDCFEVRNGHSFEQLISVLRKINSSDKPKVIIAHTTKGKGIEAFENDPKWHARKIKGEELDIGRESLGIK